MIVDNLHVVGISAVPAKTGSPLVVDANAVLSRSVIRQLLETVAGRRAQVVERRGRVELDKLTQRNPVNGLRQLPDGLPVEETLGILVPEATEHVSILTRRVNSVKRCRGVACPTNGEDGTVPGLVQRWRSPLMPALVGGT